MIDCRNSFRLPAWRRGAPPKSSSSRAASRSTARSSERWARKADPPQTTIKVDGRRLRLRRPPALHPAQQAQGRRDDAEGSRGPPDGHGSAEGVREYVYPVGRLDYDSEGLLLLTSDGDLAARLTHPRHGVERVYEAIVVGAPRRGRARKAAAGHVPRRRAHRAGARSAAAARVGKGRARDDQAARSRCKKGATARSGGCVRRSAIRCAS